MRPEEIAAYQQLMAQGAQIGLQSYLAGRRERPYRERMAQARKQFETSLGFQREKFETAKKQWEKEYALQQQKLQLSAAGNWLKQFGLQPGDRVLIPHVSRLYWSWRNKGGKNLVDFFNAPLGEAQLKSLAAADPNISAMMSVFGQGGAKKVPITVSKVFGGPAKLIRMLTLIGADIPAFKIQGEEQVVTYGPDASLAPKAKTPTKASARAIYTLPLSQAQAQYFIGRVKKGMQKLERYKKGGKRKGRSQPSRSTVRKPVRALSTDDYRYLMRNAPTNDYDYLMKFLPGKKKAKK